MNKKNKFSLLLSDLRKKERSAPGNFLVIFVVDSSDSMSIRSQMALAKGVIFSLLSHAYKRKDKVALIAFSGQQANIILNPTRSIYLARERLHKLPTGGTTPFVHGILKAYTLIQGEKVKNPEVVPVIIILSDGNANIPLKAGHDCMKEIEIIGAKIREEKIIVQAIDTKARSQRFEYGYNRKNEMKKIARYFGAKYIHIEDSGIRRVVESIRKQVD